MDACAVCFKHSGLNDPGKRRGIISLFGEINDHSANELLNLLEVSYTYYQYEEVEIQIDSPGGSVTATYYLLDQFERYKKQGKIISTVATLKAFSAAALILSCGSIGRRSAKYDSKLLYHSETFAKFLKLPQFPW